MIGEASTGTRQSITGANCYRFRTWTKPVSWFGDLEWPRNGGSTAQVITAQQWFVSRHCVEILRALTGPFSLGSRARRDCDPAVCDENPFELRRPDTGEVSGFCCFVDQTCVRQQLLHQIAECENASHFAFFVEHDRSVVHPVSEVVEQRSHLLCDRNWEG